MISYRYIYIYNIIHVYIYNVIYVYIYICSYIRSIAADGASSQGASRTSSTSTYAVCNVHVCISSRNTLLALKCDT